MRLEKRDDRQLECPRNAFDAVYISVKCTALTGIESSIGSSVKMTVVAQ